MISSSVEIRMNNIKSQIVGFNTLPFYVQNQICLKCSYVKKGFGLPNERTYLINPTNGITYTGLLPYIIPILNKYNISFIRTDLRNKPVKQFDWHISNGFTLRDYQKHIVTSAITKKRAVFQACTGAGKALTVDTLILTSNGFRPMKDVHINDIVYDESGKETRVIGEYLQGLKDVYEVIFEDGSKIECCNEHLWKVSIDNDEYQVLSVQNIINNYDCSKDNICVPINKPVHLPDESIKERFNYLRNIINLFGKLIDNELIINLKYISNKSEVINKLVFTIRSLGYRTKIVNEFVYILNPDSKIYPLMKYTRNNSLRIVSIKSLNIKKEMKCIAVNSPKHTYICQDFIVTHNTFMMANMIKKFGVPTLVLAPKASLSIQLRNEFQDFLNIKVGLINGTEVDYFNSGKMCPIVVATPQSILNHKDILRSARALFADECHNVPANTMHKVCSSTINAYYRIAVSATPWRDDGTDLLIDSVFAPRNKKDTITASELINNGVLTPVDINFLSVNSHCSWSGNYQATYMKGIVYNEERNKLVVDLAVEHAFLRNHPTIILVSKLEHGQLLLEQLKKKIDIQYIKTVYKNREYNLSNIEFLSGSDDIDYREAVFKSIREGKTKLCIATTILDEGLSISNLQCLIMAQGGCSSTRLFQRIGRVLRKYPNKDKAYVYDFMDSNSTLNNHSQIRLSLMQMEPEWNIYLN